MMMMMMIRRRTTFTPLTPLLVLLLLLLLLLSTAAAASDEKDILLQFKGNISFDPYNSLLSWHPDTPPCLHYYGVHCNSNGFVDRIVLWNTSLSGPLPPVLSALNYLRVISLFGNHFTGNIPLDYARLTALRKINVSSNALFGSIPPFLGLLPHLRFLDLSHNAFSGQIPSLLFTNCAKAKFISLSRNNLSGSIPTSISNCSNITGFDFSYNTFTGPLPYEVCASSSLSYLSVRSNALTGEVREQLSPCKSLELLDLGTNNFTGLAPFSILNLQNLTYFNISHNGFRGEVTNIAFCNQHLEVFDVSSNDIVGQIPLSITNCKGLKVLDVGFNRIDGSIPPEIGDLKKLLVISLPNNSIHGTIPVQVGSIQLLQVLDLHNLNLDGTLPDSVSNCRFLLSLDVSGNALQGAIPQTLNNMTYLEILDLHRNQFNGSIPSTLGSLLGLQILDLSQNFLSGSIPVSLQNLTLLTHFNVSFNNLSGPIPSSPNLQLFGSTAFVENPELCGPPLINPCGASLSSRKTNKKLSVSSIVAIVAACLILTGVCIISVMNIRARRRKRRKDNQGAVIVESTPLGLSESNLIIGKLVLFSKSLPSKYEDWEAGTKALLDKDCLIGGGSIGTVYRANFEGGISIAVKKIETLGRIRNQDEFEAEIGRLGSLRNQNLVSFQGYYWSSSMQLILSEFISNGSLYDNLHQLDYPGTSSDGGSSELFWARRFKIALGSARALAYLHHDCKPQILHLNIKSSNILLDANYEAKLSDYGLAKLLPMLDSYGLTKFHNAVGYVAPELAQSLRLSEKCDVYSFGIVLLELVTGRKPVERIEGNVVLILCEYVREVLERGDASDCFDRRLRGFVENELIQVMKLGLMCTSQVPSRRPSMSEVVQVLESIRTGTDE